MLLALLPASYKNPIFFQAELNEDGTRAPVPQDTGYGIRSIPCYLKISSSVLILPFDRRELSTLFRRIRKKSRKDTPTLGHGTSVTIVSCWCGIGRVTHGQGRPN